MNLRSVSPRTRRVLVAMAATQVGVTALPAPAHAVPPVPDATLALFAHAVVWIDSRTATSATVCGEGRVDDGTPVTGQWVFRVTATPTTVWTDNRNAVSYSGCYTISSAATPAGVAEATLAYVGIGGDMLAHCTDTLAWAPGSPIKGLALACVGFPTPSPTP